MMRSFILACALSSVIGVPNGIAKNLVPLSGLFPVAAVDASAVVDMHGQVAALIGQITPEAVSSLFGIIRRSAGLRVLYVDSQGGDVVAAIELAKALRLEKTRLVVAGRCFSACANYLFVGAISKDVLPGSLLGIHDLTYYFYNGKKLSSVKGIDKNLTVQWYREDATVKRKLEQIQSTERDFYELVDFSQEYHHVFVSYHKRRSAMSNDASCPDYSSWVLDRTILKKMGIKGMGAVWTPENINEMRAAATNIGLSVNDIYFGSAERLESTCSDTKTFMGKLRHFWSYRNESKKP